MDTSLQSRRQFLSSMLRTSSLLLASSLLSCVKASRNLSSPIVLANGPIIGIGVIGLGSRGTRLMKDLVHVPGVEVRAICDLLPKAIAENLELITVAGQKKPAIYDSGPEDYRNLCQRNDLDVVLIATPWRLHTPMSVEAMQSAKHAWVEVPAAISLDECAKLVEVSEKTGKQCIMLENCCFGRTEMLVLNMAQHGVFGELLHAECGYLHDLRWKLMDPSIYTDFWRLKEAEIRNGNQYPTHGLGPVAQCLNINRGDRFDYLVSMSSISRGLNLQALKDYGPDHPFTTRKYAQGDINAALIKTVNGKTIVLTYNTSNPRPYSRVNMIQGTKGIFSGFPDRIHIEGEMEPEKWESDLGRYFEKYEHPQWKKFGPLTIGGGHDGMDVMMLFTLVQSLREGKDPPLDVYDAASWSCISELSERSTAKHSQAQSFPDYTKGKWQKRTPVWS